MSVLLVRELTARAQGAIRVLEVRGEDAARAVEELAARRLVPGSVVLSRLRGPGGAWLDEALVLTADRRHVELHLHGSALVVARVRAALGESAEPSLPGLEEAAEELLADAPSEAAARILLDQAEGALRRELGALASGDPGARRSGLERLADRGRRARLVLEPPLLVLAGPVNAGKSTLFNAVLGHERVVVDPDEGTTRDAVRERAVLGELAFDLVDTAGERALGSGPRARVELAGQGRGRALRAAADLVLWLAPRPVDVPDPLPERTLVLASRVDESGGATHAPGISARADPAGARAVLAEAVRERLGLGGPLWEPGAGVPFTPELCAAVDRALETDGPDPLLEWLGSKE